MTDTTEHRLHEVIAGVLTDLDDALGALVADPAALPEVRGPATCWPRCCCPT